MDPLLIAGLEARSPVLFQGIEFDCDGSTIRLMLGSGTTRFDSKTFTGRHATYGTLGSVDGFTDGAGNEAVSLNFTILPPNLTAAEALVAAAMQGVWVTKYFGVISRATGLPLGAPEVEFRGIIDTIGLQREARRRVVSFGAIGGMDRLLRANEGNRVTNANHQRRHPGELGAQYINSLGRVNYWGQNGPQNEIGGGAAQGFSGAANNALRTVFGG